MSLLLSVGGGHAALSATFTPKGTGLLSSLFVTKLLL